MRMSIIQKSTTIKRRTLAARPTERRVARRATAKQWITAEVLATMRRLTMNTTMNMLSYREQSIPLLINRREVTPTINHHNNRHQDKVTTALK